MNNYFLSVDIGNSNLSIARSDFANVISYFNDNNIHEVFKKWCQDPLSKIVFCNVISDKIFSINYPLFYKTFNEFKKMYPEKFSCISTFKVNNFFLKMPIDYSESLGFDRVAQGYFAWNKLQKDENNHRAIILSAGTMLTINIIDKIRGFIGGHILPGLKAYVSSFSDAPKLPEGELIINQIIQKSSTTSSHCPQNTLDAIAFGYLDSVSCLIKETMMIHHVNQVYCTGGQIKLWSQFFQNNKILSIDEPYLTHLSLWQIGNEIARIKE